MNDDLVDLDVLYAESRRRLGEVITAAGPGAGDRPVAACPGWTVRDVIAHLVGVIEDANAGRISGIPEVAQTAEQVARHRDDPVEDLLARWAELAPPFEAVIAQLQIAPAYFDVLSHEHDVRAALGAPGDREDRGVVFAGQRLCDVGDARVRIDVGEPGEPPPDGATYVLRASPFDVLRFRLGRRTADQVRAMRWSADPTPILPQLFVFGPAAVAVEE